MTESEAIALALDGQGVLFLGSGFSLGAKTAKREDGHDDILSAPGFARYLGKAAGIGEDAGLEDASDEFERLRGPEQLVATIKQHFIAAEVAAFHRTILSIPWKRIYTTNYDNVAELASEDEKKALKPCGARDDFNSLRGGPTLSIHLNGYAPTLQTSDLRRDFKLTEGSYAAATITDTPGVAYFRQDIRMADVVIFLGYGMSDLDIKRLLAEHPASIAKTLFFVGNNPTAECDRRVRRYGTPIHSTAEEFASAVSTQKTTHVRSASADRLRYLAEYVASGPPATISDSDVINLLLWGKHTTDQIAASMVGGVRYYQERPELNKILDSISAGKRMVVLHSRLGNGKTLLIEGLKVRLREIGYRVLQARDADPSIQRELEAVARSGKKVALFFERYSTWLSEIELFWRNCDPSSLVVATDRSHAHDFFSNELEHFCGEDSIVEFACDRMRDNEIRWIVSFLDQYGLWGELAGAKTYVKVKHVETMCLGQWHGVLLEIMKSPDIATRISKITSRLLTIRRDQGPIYAILILAVLGEPATYDVLTDLYDTSTITRRSVEADPAMSELFEVDSYECRVRSAVVANYILAATDDGESIIQTLVHMAERFHRLSGVRPLYKKLSIQLLRVSVVAPLFPEKQPKLSILDYYERLRAAIPFQREPQFWLQYAIAALVCKDLERSKTYFETAYSIGESIPNYDTFKIDNHYVRYLMAKAQEVDSVDVFWPMFLESSRIIDRQMRKERGDFPFKVARDLPLPVNRFKTVLKPPQKRTIIAFARRVHDQIKALPGYRQSNKWVQHCKRSMEEVIVVLSADNIEPESDTPSLGE
ncbi:MAG TPA: SIR2 family protein [Tepidisphaeraceae bacterium]|jgi:hypothetical protein|nr:SIR2 family protein [Tepidisphaeraceae bacterium]